ncbi:hypothetical protein EON65_36660, partial [archaeon]
MGMTAFYGDFDRDAQEAESLKTIGRALELGINFLDTAWIYQVKLENTIFKFRLYYVDTVLCISSSNLSAYVVHSIPLRLASITPTKNWWARQSRSMGETSSSSPPSLA